MCRIAHQRNRSVIPVGDRVAVDHGIFIGDICSRQKIGHIQPIESEFIEIRSEFGDCYGFEPATFLPFRRAVDGTFRNPVDGR